MRAMSRFPIRTRRFLASAALAALVALGGCNDAKTPAESSFAAAVPALPATMPLALGAPTLPVYAPAVAELPRAPLLQTVQVADPGEHYAYAENAWSYVDALGDAPPDYGFYEDEVEPWAWQGYDDSAVFVEPLDEGYRYYFYRAGYDEPYFIRDPYYGYGYDDGRLAVVYDPYGAVVPYWDYGPQLDYASRYYVRGCDLYRSSRHRHPVIVSNWVQRQDPLIWAREDWATDRGRQRDWTGYHQRVAPRQQRYWQAETVRRRADSVRFAAWREADFRSAPPPRAIPAAWRRADWARDTRRYAPPARGFAGNAVERTRAELAERRRVKELRQARIEQRTERRVAERALRQDEQRVLHQAERVARREEGQALRAERRQPRVERAAEQRREQRQALVEQRRETRERAVEQRRVRADVQRRQAERPAQADRQREANRDRQEARQAARETQNLVRQREIEQRGRAEAQQRASRMRAQAEQRQQARQSERREQAASRQRDIEQRGRAVEAQQRAGQMRAQAEARQQARQAEVQQRQQAQAQERQQRSQAQERQQSAERQRNTDAQAQRQRTADAARAEREQRREDRRQR
jgi:hypothetical protein